jgi:ATP-dependent RNA helicase RhlE
MNRLTFQDLGLNPSLLKALDKLNYQAPTPIQSQAIPILLEGHDLLATAQTGTGKTASFVLPLLQGLLERQPNLKAPMDPRGTERHSRGRQPNPRREGRGRDKGRQSLSNRNPYVPQALILAPTRELAIQIGESIQGYAQGTAVKHVVIYGGAPQAPQIQKMSKLPQILVATPGRLLAYEEEGIIDLSQIIELVLDEADRMLDMGFIGDVKKVARMTQNREQTLLFSATMPPEIEALGAFLLREPKRVAIAPKEVAVDRIRQSVFHLEQADKLNLLKQVIQDRSMYKVIVFTRTKHRAARVSKVLQKAGIPADAIHGDRNQNQRQRALAGLKSGKVQALVATDVAARGIDVDDVTHVINFEIPHESESYVHRIGRTARAGSDGMPCPFAILKSWRT